MKAGARTSVMFIGILTAAMSGTVGCKMRLAPQPTTSGELKDVNFLDENYDTIKYIGTVGPSPNRQTMLSCPAQWNFVQIGNYYRTRISLDPSYDGSGRAADMEPCVPLFVRRGKPCFLNKDNQKKVKNAVQNALIQLNIRGEEEERLKNIVDAIFDLSPSNLGNSADKVSKVEGLLKKGFAASSDVSCEK